MPKCAASQRRTSAKRGFPKPQRSPPAPYTILLDIVSALAERAVLTKAWGLLAHVGHALIDGLGKKPDRRGARYARARVDVCMVASGENISPQTEGLIIGVDEYLPIHKLSADEVRNND